MEGEITPVSDKSLAELEAPPVPNPPRVATSPRLRPLLEVAEVIFAAPAAEQAACRVMNWGAISGAGQAGGALLPADKPQRVRALPDDGDDDENVRWLEISPASQVGEPNGSELRSASSSLGS